MAGLQLIWPITPMFMVTRSTRAAQVGCCRCRFAAGVAAAHDDHIVCIVTSLLLMFHVERTWLDP
jgi:hypothetical protein